jgi:hypothetical protein
MQIKCPSCLHNEQRKMLEQTLQQLNLAVEGLLLSDYKEYQELPLFLREEGALTFQYYQQTISKLAADLASLVKEA